MSSSIYNKNHRMHKYTVMQVCGRYTSVCVALIKLYGMNRRCCFCLTLYAMPYCAVLYCVAEAKSNCGDQNYAAEYVKSLGHDQKKTIFILLYRESCKCICHEALRCLWCANSVLIVFTYVFVSIDDVQVLLFFQNHNVPAVHYMLHSCVIM